MTPAPWRPLKVIDLELAGCLAGVEPLAGLEGLAEYGEIQALIRLHGTPLGFVRVPVTDAGCPSAVLGRAVLERHADGIIRRLVRLRLAVGPLRAGWDPVTLLALAPQLADATPSMTVAVCTRDRPAELAQSLEALRRSGWPGLEVLVVDNAPETDVVRTLVETRFPEVRYVGEPRPGVDRARNRAILEASGQILAFTDDDARVDPGWARALGRAFTEQPDVMAVTGPVVPEELETEAQQLFEDYGGFGRGFERRWCRAEGDPLGRSVGYHRPAQFGTGANMAFRRDVFARIGGFDPRLDVGTPTEGGGDLEMFFRVMQEGNTLAYEPDALVRHRHRRELGALERQIAAWGSGFFAYLARSWTAYPRERLVLAAVGARWLGRWVVRRGMASLVSPGRHPWRLALAELRGAAAGPAAWRRSRRAAVGIADGFGLGRREMPLTPSAPPPAGCRSPRREVRRIDLAEPVGPLRGLDGCTGARLEVTFDGRTLGVVDIATPGPEVGATQIGELLAERLGTALLDPSRPSDGTRQWLALYGALAERLAPGQIPPAPRVRARGFRPPHMSRVPRPDPSHA